MEEKFDNKSTQLIANKFELNEDLSSVTEEQLVLALAERIEYLLRHRMDFLRSLLYRLDVLEVNINKAMLPGNPEPPHIALARLVIQRQKQRIETREKYKSKDFEDLEGWDY